MRELDLIATKKVQRVQVPFPNGTTSLNLLIDTSKRRRGSDGPIAKAFNNEARDHLSAEIARLFYTAGLPFNVAKNPHFIKAFTYAANTSISGYVPPNYNSIRTTMLPRERLLQPIKDTWYEKGVNIVSNGWTDAQRRPLINFMAISNATPMFLKAIDGTREFKDKYYIANLISETISEVGAQNVVQIITDNPPVCKVAGSIVEGTYPRIFLSPCVVHTLNLALRNICAPKPENEDVYRECIWIALTTADGNYIKKFITNHSMRFAMFKKCVDLPFLSISETRFASVIVMLKRFKTIKKGLLSLPIYDMLRSCDTDESNLRLVYEKWDSMIEQVKVAIYKHENKELTQYSSFYDVVYNILIDRWTKSHTPLHCLAHSLNPRSVEDWKWEECEDLEG
ncbi:hypothetical protein QL285_014899 [Trifolium repens]|nr:hypothetical protein QL285_014899 [Trifolium repens]